MSITSKARRDARKKKQPKSHARARKPSAQAHATLHDGAGNLMAGAELRGKEWVFVMNGQVVAETDSAAMMMAMLRHTACVHEGVGLAVRLACSTALTTAASREAEAEGKTLDAYLETLEAERAERSESRQALNADSGDEATG